MSIPILGATIPPFSQYLQQQIAFAGSYRPQRYSPRMEAVPMQGLEPTTTRGEPFPPLQEHEMLAGQTKGHKHFEKLRHRCRVVGQGNLLWNAVEKQPSQPRGPVDVPAHARRRSSIARQNAVERSREEEEKRQRVLERSTCRAQEQRERGTSNGSVAPQSRTRRLSELCRFRASAQARALARAPVRTLSSFILEEQHHGRGLETAAVKYQSYANSRRNSASGVASTAGGPTVKKAKSMGHLAAVVDKTGASPSSAGENDGEEPIRTSKSEANLGSMDSGYSSNRNSDLQPPNKLLKKTLYDGSVFLALRLFDMDDLQRPMYFSQPFSSQPHSPSRSSNMNKPHSAAQSWSYHVPSPPRVIVPQPNIDPWTGKSPALSLEQYANHDFKSTGFDNIEFLRTVTYGGDSAVISHAMVTWKYESRRSAQAILPFLFLGPITAARDRDFLRTQGITMLLAVRDSTYARSNLLSSKAALELGIPCSTVDTAGKQGLIAAFPHGIEMINAHLSDIYKQSQISPLSDRPWAPGKVLVFCETGNDRSAAMVVAYLMAMYSMDVVKAIQMVCARRFSVATDETLRYLLQTYESILKAKRDVVHSAQRSSGENADMESAYPSFLTSHGMSGLSRKRTMDETLDDDDDMGMEAEAASDDGARFDKREGAAPFLDGARLW
ncbi:MAG: hypothetical protein Q9171_005302 [Xanthocarpia ochracea]